MYKQILASEMDNYSSMQQSTSSINLAMNSTASILSHPIEHEMEQQMLGMNQQQPATKYLNHRDKILMFQLNQYYMSKAIVRSKMIAKTIQEVVKIVHDVLRELEIQEPRFISTFTEINGHYEG